MSKKLLSLLLCLVAIFTLCFAGCGEEEDDSTNEEASARKAVSINVMLISEKEVSKETEALVEEAFNELTQAKFTTKVDFVFFSEDEYFDVLDRKLADAAEYKEMAGLDDVLLPGLTPEETEETEKTEETKVTEETEETEETKENEETEETENTEETEVTEQVAEEQGGGEDRISKLEEQVGKILELLTKKEGVEAKSEEVYGLGNGVFQDENKAPETKKISASEIAQLLNKIKR